MKKVEILSVLLYYSKGVRLSFGMWRMRGCVCVFVIIKIRRFCNRERCNTNGLFLGSGGSFTYILIFIVFVINAKFAVYIKKLIVGFIFVC